MRGWVVQGVLGCLVLCGLLLVGLNLTGNAVVSFAIASNCSSHGNLTTNCSCPLVLNSSFFEANISTSENASCEEGIEFLSFDYNPSGCCEGLPGCAYDFIEVNVCEDIRYHLDHWDLILPYSNESGVPIEEVVGYYHNESAGLWEEVTTTFDENESEVILHLDHFSLFAVGARANYTGEVVSGGEEGSGGSGGGWGGECSEGYVLIDGKCVVVSFDEANVSFENESVIPERLFDIGLSLEESVLRDACDLVALVNFENFGRVETLVNLSFEVFDVDGNLVYSLDDYVVVETVEVLSEEFEGLVLAKGNYVLVLRTLYDIDVTDEFRAEFSVVERDVILWWWVLGVVVLVGFLILFFVWFRRDDEKEDWLECYKKMVKGGLRKIMERGRVSGSALKRLREELVRIGKAKVFLDGERRKLVRREREVGRRISREREVVALRGRIKRVRGIRK